jgi:hypothetical protein
MDGPRVQRMNYRCSRDGRRPDNHGNLVAPGSLATGPTGQGPIMAGGTIDESVQDLEPEDTE